MFRIAEFARLSGVSARTLRKWDAAGVFRPAWTDPAIRVPRLLRRPAAGAAPRPRAARRRRAARTRSRQLVRGGDARAALERRREELEAARREAERRLRALDISVAMADDPAAPDVVVRPVAEELVAWVPLPAGDEPESDRLVPARGGRP